MVLHVVSNNKTGQAAGSGRVRVSNGVSRMLRGGIAEVTAFV